MASMAMNDTLVSPLAKVSLTDLLTSPDYLVLLLRLRNIGFLVLVYITFFFAVHLFKLPFVLAGCCHGDKEMRSVSVSYQLVKEDNKAFALSLAGYLLGVGLMVRGALFAPYPSELLIDELVAVGYAFAWTGIGLVFMFIVHVLNNTVVFSGLFFGNVGVLQGNVAVGLLEAGHFVASGLIIMGCFQSNRLELFEENLAASALYFVLGEICLLVFTKLYQLTTRYNDVTELKDNNAAAGLGYSLTIIALGLLLSNPIGKSHSLLAFAVAAVLGSTLLFITRLLVDVLFLPGRLLDKEIAQDRNYGAALLEGTVAVVIAAVWSTFLDDAAPNSKFAIC